MKEQLLLLHKLQELDAKAREIQSALDALPEKLAPAKRDLARLEDMLGAEEQHIFDTDNWRKEQEELIRRESDALKAAKTKLQATKNARDFAAASREIDNKKRSVHQREEEVLKVLEALEVKRKTLEAHQTDVEQLRSTIRAEEEAQAGTAQDLQARLAEHVAGRDEIARQLPGQLLARYEHVAKQRGIAVVPVVGGVCQGCHMKLTAQLNNVLARFESIEKCRQCGRLLYRSELLEDDLPAASDS